MDEAENDDRNGKEYDGDETASMEESQTVQKAVSKGETASMKESQTVQKAVSKGETASMKESQTVQKAVSKGETASMKESQTVQKAVSKGETASMKESQTVQKAVSKGCQTRLPKTCTQETQTQEVEQASCTVLRGARSDRRMCDIGVTATPPVTFRSEGHGNTFLVVKYLQTHQYLPTHQLISPTCQRTSPAHQQISSTHQQSSPTHQQISPTHQQISHQKAREFKCPYCSYVATKKFRLTAHKKTHESELLPCSVCHKRFFLREDLEKHMRVHTMERPYECDVCGQSFRQLCNMRRHRNMHMGPQATHTCPDCDKAFVEKGHLKSHLRTHTGERPFQCSQCDMRFTEKSSVKKHEQMVHARVFPHYCPHCGKGIANNYKLKRHVHWCQLGTKKEDKEARTGTTK